jgi:predicted RNase H-like HicB family nuclease
MPGHNFLIGQHAVRVTVNQAADGAWGATVVVDGPGLDAASATYLSSFAEAEEALEFGVERAHAAVAIMRRRLR